MKDDWPITAGGIGFAGLTLLGLFLLMPGVAGGDTTNAEAVAWVKESGHQYRGIAGAYLMCAGAIAMVVFMAGVLRRLRAAGAGPLLVDVARLSGLAFVVCQVVAAMAMASAVYAVSAGNEPTPIDPGVARITTFGLALWLVPGMLSAALFAALVGAAVLSTKAFPTWVGLSGLLLAAVLLAAILFLPALLLMLWAIAVALVATVSRNPAPALDPLTASP
ncbi:MAG: hypothetical protein AB7J35_03050 [Dehalococcoidia bacterium]